MVNNGYSIKELVVQFDYWDIPHNTINIEKYGREYRPPILNPFLGWKGDEEEFYSLYGDKYDYIEIMLNYNHYQLIEIGKEFNIFQEDPQDSSKLIFTGYYSPYLIELNVDCNKLMDWDDTFKQEKELNNINAKKTELTYDYDLIKLFKTFFRELISQTKKDVELESAELLIKLYALHILTPYRQNKCPHPFYLGAMRSGKSTFNTILREMVGDEFVSSFDNGGDVPQINNNDFNYVKDQLESVFVLIEELGNKFPLEANQSKIKGWLDGNKFKQDKQKYKDDVKKNDIAMVSGNDNNKTNISVETANGRGFITIVSDNRPLRSHIIKSILVKDNIPTSKQLLFNLKLFFHQYIINQYINPRIHNKDTKTLQSISKRLMVPVRSLLVKMTEAFPQQEQLKYLFNKLGFNLRHILKVAMNEPITLPSIMKTNLSKYEDINVDEWDDDEYKLDICGLFYKITGGCVPECLNNKVLQQVSDNYISNIMDCNDYMIDDVVINDEKSISYDDFVKQITDYKKQNNIGDDEIQTRLRNAFSFKLDVSHPRNNLNNIFMLHLQQTSDNKARQKKVKTTEAFKPLIQKYQEDFNCEKEQAIYLFDLIYKFTQDEMVQVIFS